MAMLRVAVGTAVDIVRARFQNAGHDPEFYAAKALLRELLPDADLIELLPDRVTVVTCGEVTVEAL